MNTIGRVLIKSTIVLLHINLKQTFKLHKQCLNYTRNRLFAHHDRV